MIPRGPKMQTFRAPGRRGLGPDGGNCNEGSETLQDAPFFKRRRAHLAAGLARRFRRISWWVRHAVQAPPLNEWELMSRFVPICPVFHSAPPKFGEADHANGGTCPVVPGRYSIPANDDGFRCKSQDSSARSAGRA